ncbi:MAG: MarR family winged helix-turn-helix transcriptional regulator [Actinomycetota bacterium]
MSGSHTLSETERQVATKLKGMSLDFDSMAAVSNVFRAANATRNYFESTVLASSGLSWTAFVVMWVSWIWEPIETREIAEEGGFSKATLTGVLQTLESRGLLERNRSAKDKRLMIVTLTPKGRNLMKKLFPEFNKHEQKVLSGLSKSEKRELSASLRKITTFTESRS